MKQEMENYADTNEKVDCHFSAIPSGCPTLVPPLCWHAALYPLCMNCCPDSFLAEYFDKNLSLAYMTGSKVLQEYKGGIGFASRKKSMRLHYLQHGHINAIIHKQWCMQESISYKTLCKTFGFIPIITSIFTNGNAWTQCFSNSATNASVRSLAISCSLTSPDFIIDNGINVRSS